MKIDVNLQDLFLSLNVEEERKKRIKAKGDRIKYEFSLYNCFCKIFGLKSCRLESYKFFQLYCHVNHISLL